MFVFPICSNDEIVIIHTTQFQLILVNLIFLKTIKYLHKWIRNQLMITSDVVAENICVQQQRKYYILNRSTEVFVAIKAMSSK